MTRITEKTAKLVVGKTIARITTCECEDTANTEVTHVGIIEFTDGSRMSLNVSELSDAAEYAITAIYRPKQRGERHEG